MEEERVVEEVTENVTNNTDTYERINRLNMALDELANDMTIDDSAENKELEVRLDNEVEMPEVEKEELLNDLEKAIGKESTEENEEVENDNGSKGQFILIGILTIILIALLIAMLIFTNAL